MGAVQVEFLDETPMVGTYAHPKPSAAYYTNYLAGLVGPPRQPALNVLPCYIQLGLLWEHSKPTSLAVEVTDS